MKHEMLISRMLGKTMMWAGMAACLGAFLGAGAGSMAALGQPMLPMLPSSARPSVAAAGPLDANDALTADANDAGMYANGTRAIQDQRWADAEGIFDRIAAGHGEHVEGALYWKAYAQNKQGKSDAALKTCASLRMSSPKSRWIDDCGALEIEIRGKSGQPVEPQAEQDESLRLLALNAMMHQNASKALPEIQQVLTSDQPEKFKEQALFVLAQNGSKGAQKILAWAANPPADAPASLQTNAALRQRARLLISAGTGSAATTAPLRSNHRIGLDVVVKDASGKPVSGLDADSFSVLDNGQPRKILGFAAGKEAAGEAHAKVEPPTEVMILFDTVNSSVLDVAYQRDQVATFLRENGGQLAYPVSLLIMDGDGSRRLTGASRDGNALAEQLRRAEAGYGQLERIQLSVTSLAALAAEEATRPGRKILIWLSPGWPLLASTDAQVTQRETKTYHDSVVALSAALRQSRITLDSIDPVRNAGADSAEWFRYQEYRKPVTRKDHAYAGNLALQVLAEQSGGRAMNYSKAYLSGEIAECLADADTYYYLTFDTPAAPHMDEYHALKITVNKPGLTVMTRSGYYDEP
jgi:VWFA-related protein